MCSFYRYHTSKILRHNMSKCGKNMHIIKCNRQCKWISNTEINDILEKCAKLSTIFTLSNNKETAPTNSQSSNNSNNNNNKTIRNTIISEKNHNTNANVNSYSHGVSLFGSRSNQSNSVITIDLSNENINVSNIKIENVSERYKRNGINNNNESKLGVNNVSTYSFCNMNNNDRINAVIPDKNGTISQTLPTISWNGDKKACPICHKKKSSTDDMNRHYNNYCRPLILRKFGKCEAWWQEYRCNVQGCKNSNSYYVDLSLHKCKFGARDDYTVNGQSVNCPQCEHNVANPEMIDWSDNSCISTLKIGNFRGKKRAVCSKWNAKPPKLCCQWYSIIDETT